MPRRLPQSYGAFQRAALPAGAVVSGPGYPDRWLRQHHQEHADAISGSAPRQLPAPRDQQAPEETGGDRVAGPQGLALAVPHLVVPGAPAERAYGCLRWASGCRRFADHVATTAGTANGERVRRWFQDKKAGWYAVLADPQMPVTSTLLDQAHNAIERQALRDEGVSPSRWQPTGVSHRAGTPLQPGAVSTPGPAWRPLWGGSRGREFTHA